MPWETSLLARLHVTRVLLALMSSCPLHSGQFSLVKLSSTNKTRTKTNPNSLCHFSEKKR